MIADDYKFNFRKPETFSYDNVNPYVGVSKNEIMHIAERLRNPLNFPNNGVIFIPNDINVGSFNSREVIDRLRSLADKLEKEHSENID